MVSVVSAKEVGVFNTDISLNVAESRLGVVSIAGSEVVRFSGCNFTRNIVYAGSGGSIAVDRSTLVSISGCAFVGNSANRTAEFPNVLAHGAAVHVSNVGGVAKVVNCSFVNNTA